MNKIKLLLSGIIVGAGAILPGISGSVLAIILGLYDFILLILNSNKTIINKIKELYPILLGIIIGIIIFGKLLLYFFNDYEILFRYIFIGLILGSIPALNKEVKNNNEKIVIKYFIISFFISIILFFFPILINIKFNCNSFITLLLGGFLYISGKIIPGISSTFFLMILGLYDYFLRFISFSFSIKDIINFYPFILGVVIGIISLVKLINYLFKKYHQEFYSSIIGFVLGSIISIFPGFTFNSYYIISVIFMILIFLFLFNYNYKN